jgi:hypothetical protein
MRTQTVFRLSSKPRWRKRKQEGALVSFRLLSPSVPIFPRIVELLLQELSHVPRVAIWVYKRRGILSAFGSYMLSGKYGAD